FSAEKTSEAASERLFRRLDLDFIFRHLFRSPQAAATLRAPELAVRSVAALQMSVLVSAVPQRRFLLLPIPARMLAAVHRRAHRVQSRVLYIFSRRSTSDRTG